MTGKMIAAYCGYVVVAASFWIPNTALSQQITDRQIDILASALVVCGVVGVGRRSDVGLITRTQWARGVSSGLLLFGLSSMVSKLGVGGVPAVTRVALLALVPAGVVVISAVRAAEGETEFLGLLGAALAGVAGGLLLLPTDPEVLLERPLAALLLGVLVVGVAVGSYVGHGVMRELPFRSGALLLLGPSLLVKMMVAFYESQGMARPSVGDGVAIVWRCAELLLLLLLLRGVRPVAFAARYLLIPLVTAAEGAVALRPAITWRLELGAVLVVGGAVRLLQGRSRRDSPMSLL